MNMYGVCVCVQQKPQNRNYSEHEKKINDFSVDLECTREINFFILSTHKKKKQTEVTNRPTNWNTNYFCFVAIEFFNYWD